MLMVIYWIKSLDTMGFSCFKMVYNERFTMNGLQWFRLFSYLKINFRPQFVDNLFIVRLRPNMSVRRAVIINYFLVHKIEVKNLISSTTDVFQIVNEVCLSQMKSPWQNPESKEHRINN